MHSASGCEEDSSVARTRERISSSEISVKLIKSLTTGLPSVNVAVLSISRQFTRLSVSMLSAFLYSTPREAPFPAAAITATGVASPSAHGQEITSTLTAYRKARETSFVTSNQTRKVRAAIAVTTGTKIPAILSATRCTGALDAAASRTICTTREKAASSPTFSARITSIPLDTILPEIA